MATTTQTLAVIARLLDLSERRVQQLAREGVIPRAADSGPERGRYDLVGSVRGYVRYLREQAAHASSGGTDLGVERARLVKAKADLAEMDAAARRGELLVAALVEDAWIAVLARLRARLLVLPDRLAPLVHQERTIAGTRERIRDGVAEALAELASRPVVAVAAEGPAAAGDGGAAGGRDLSAAAVDDP